MISRILMNLESLLPYAILIGSRLTQPTGLDNSLSILTLHETALTRR